MAATPGAPAPCAPPHAQRKVFYLVDSFNVGGTETQAVELALRIPMAGYDVTLGCLRAEGPLLERLHGIGIAVREFHPPGGIDTPAGLYQLLRLSWFLRREKFDIVHTHDLWSNLLGVPAARLAGVPAIVSSRRDLAHSDWYRGKRRVLAAADPEFIRRSANQCHTHPRRLDCRGRVPIRTRCA